MMRSPLQLLFLFLTLLGASEGRCVAELNVSTTTNKPFRGNCLYTIDFNWKVSDKVVPVYSEEIANNLDCNAKGLYEPRAALVVYTYETKMCQMYGVGVDLTMVAEWPPNRLTDAWVNFSPCNKPADASLWSNTFTLYSGESYKYVVIDKTHSKIAPVP